VSFPCPSLITHLKAIEDRKEGELYLEWNKVL